MEKTANDLEVRMREAESYLYEVPKFTSKNPMDHTRRLMERLGNPQDSFRVIHVAGSNGKGSVCSFLFSILKACGISAGMFSSPHLVDIRERFALTKSGMCSREAFLAAYDRVLAEAAGMREEGEAYPTFFEILFAMGMLIFAESGVDYLILETGLGGRLDATNTVRQPAVCVITSLSLEHTEYLGDTIEQIAFEKAGIIKPGVPVVFDANVEAASEVIRARAKELGCESYEIHKNLCRICETTGGGIDFSFASPYDKKTDCHLPFGAPYQMMNAALAITAFYRLVSQDSRLAKADPDRMIREGIAGTSWPGRMQELRPDVFLDGAHNPGGIRVFTDAVRLLCAEDEIAPILLFSMVQDKDFHESIRILLTRVSWSAVCVTEIPSERGLSAQTLYEEVEAMASCPVTCSQDYRAAFDRMRSEKKPGQKLFVAGSLYLIGDIMKSLE